MKASRIKQAYKYISLFMTGYILLVIAPQHIPHMTAGYNVDDYLLIATLSLESLQLGYFLGRRSAEAKRSKSGSL